MIKRLTDLGGSIPKKAERSPAKFEKLVKSEIVALEADPRSGCATCRRAEE